ERLALLDAERDEHAEHDLVAILDRLGLDDLGQVPPVVETDRMGRSPGLAPDGNELRRGRIRALAPGINPVLARDLLRGAWVAIERPRPEPHLVAGRARDDEATHLADVRAGRDDQILAPAAAVGP